MSTAAFVFAVCSLAPVLHACAVFRPQRSTGCESARLAPLPTSLPSMCLAAVAVPGALDGGSSGPAAEGAGPAGAPAASLPGPGPGSHPPQLRQAFGHLPGPHGIPLQRLQSPGGPHTAAAASAAAAPPQTCVSSPSGASQAPPAWVAATTQRGWQLARFVGSPLARCCGQGFMQKTHPLPFQCSWH